MRLIQYHLEAEQSSRDKCRVGVGDKLGIVVIILY